MDWCSASCTLPRRAAAQRSSDNLEPQARRVGSQLVERSRVSNFHQNQPSAKSASL